MTDTAPVLIAGGGIGGLALAVALARLGRRSTVLERQAAPAEAGAGIQLGPNAVRALQWLGVADALHAWVGEPEAIEVHAGTSGRRLARLPLGRWIAERHGAPYWVAHRGDLYRVLAAAAAAEPRIEMRTGFEVASVAEMAGGVTVTDPAGRRLVAPVLVGADGLWSAVRQALWPHCVPQAAGATATRTVIPTARAGRLATDAVGVWFGPQAHVVHYPVRRAAEIALVVIAREPEMRADRRGWDAQVDPGRLQRRLAPFHAGLREVLLPRDGHSWPWREWTLHTLPPLPAWSRGRVTVLGDAAHPMLPYLAQGGALALEDAVVLAECLHAAGEDPGSGLTLFEEQRAGRARRVQAASLRQGRIYHLPPPLSWGRDAVLSLLPGPALMAGYDWLYAWRPPQSAQR
jgi:salicylate hydroxylase